MRDWAELYKEELERMWKTQEYKKLPGLEWTMPDARRYPKVCRVEPRPWKTLRVTFENGVQKDYDCKPLLQSEAFRSLHDDAIFQSAQADAHGFGIVWNDEIDLAESEVWINGQDVEQ